MADLEDQLRSYADQVESAVGPTPTLPAAPDRRRRPWLGWAAALVLVAAIGVGIGFALDDGDDEAPDTRVDPPTTSTTSAPDEPTPTTTVPFPTPEAAFDPGPLSVRHDALVLRTPDEVIVWGGDVEAFNIGRPDLESEQFADGAVFGLDTTGGWRMMADAPLPAVDATPLGVWLGSDALIVRVDQAARYDPATDTWTELPDAPFRLWDLVHAPEIDAVFGVGRDGVVRFDPATDTWSDTGPFAPWERTEVDFFPQDPDPDPSVVWAGDQLVAVAGDLAGRFPVQSWRPGGEWEARGHIVSGISQVAIDAARVDDEVWVVGYDMTVHAFDPASGSVRELPGLPVLFQEGTPEIDQLADGRVIVRRWPGVAVWTGDGWEVEPMSAMQGGTIAPGVDGQPAVWQFSVGFEPGDGNRFGVVALPRAGTLREVLIGAVALDLGTDLELVSQILARPATARGNLAFFVTPIDATVRLADGAECTFSYGPQAGDGVTGILFDSERYLAYDCPTSVVAPLVDRMRDIWADGAEPAVVVPAVIGLAEEEARSTLAALGYEVQVVAEVNFETVGVVFRQDPVPGTGHPLTSPVVIYVSAGPDTATVPVPTVIGLFYDTAEATLRNVGLVPVIEFRQVPFGDPQVGLVIEQTPPNFVEVSLGSEVIVVVGEAAPAPEPPE